MLAALLAVTLLNQIGMNMGYPAEASVVARVWGSWIAVPLPELAYVRSAVGSSSASSVNLKLICAPTVAPCV
jgi:hypothetical protein